MAAASPTRTKSSLHQALPLFWWNGNSDGNKRQEVDICWAFSILLLSSNDRIRFVFGLRICSFMNVFDWIGRMNSVSEFCFRIQFLFYLFWFFSVSTLSIFLVRIKRKTTASDPHGLGPKKLEVFFSRFDDLGMLHSIWASNSAIPVPTLFARCLMHSSRW